MFRKRNGPTFWWGRFLSQALSRQLVREGNSYTLNDDPQPQVLFTFGFSNLKPAPSSVST